MVFRRRERLAHVAIQTNNSPASNLVTLPNILFPARIEVISVRHTKSSVKIRVTHSEIRKQYLPYAHPAAVATCWLKVNDAAPDVAVM